jgi:hypothetical protein
MHPDIRNIASQSNNLLAEFKRRGDTYRFDHHVAAEVVGFSHDRGHGVGGAAADVGAHGFCGIQTGGVVVDHDDLGGGVEEGGQEGTEADGAGADDCDGFAGGDGAGEDADFVARWDCRGGGGE